jgi:hypothetical protein
MAPVTETMICNLKDGVDLGNVVGDGATPDEQAFMRVINTLKTKKGAKTSFWVSRPSIFSSNSP